MTFQKIARTFVLAIVSSMLIGTTGCVKQDYDLPTAGANIDPPGIVANMTIAQLKAKYFQRGFILPIPDSIIISGVVNGDDRSGNLYKVLSIQDSTGGIQINIDQTNMYNDFPFGRRVFVNCKGMVIGDYPGMVQLGSFVDRTGTYPSVGKIPSANIPNYIVKGKWGVNVPIRHAKITDFVDYINDQSMLIQLDDVEFKCADVGSPMGDAPNKASLNRNLEDCSFNAFFVRSSGYANFASNAAPGGKGTLLGLYSVFFHGSGVMDQQIIIRNFSDIQFTNPNRCDGINASVTGDKTIGDLRASYPGSGTMVIPSGTLIHGVVISDPSNGNAGGSSSNPYLIIQDGTGGIAISCSLNPQYQLGDSVSVSSCGASLALTANNLLVMSGVNPNTNIIKLGSVTPSVRTASLAEITANFKTWESTLVRVQNVTFSGTGTYGSSPNIADGTGSIKLFTANTAAFAGATYPSTATSVTGILQLYNTTQEMRIRNLADVK